MINLGRISRPIKVSVTFRPCFIFFIFAHKKASTDRTFIVIVTVIFGHNL